METTFTEEFKRNWLRSSFGVFLHLAGTCLLAWNEGRSIISNSLLLEAYSNCVSVKPYERPAYSIEGKIVHLKGRLIVKEPLTADEYGISIEAVKLKLRTQMYQWVEEQEPREYDDKQIIFDQTNNKHYYYVNEWKDTLVDSSKFFIKHKYENPKRMPLNNKVFMSAHVRVGNYRLSEELKAKFNDFEEVTGAEQPERKDIKLHSGIYYHCNDLFHPKVGDYRVKFYYAGLTGDYVSIIAQYYKGVLIPYVDIRGTELYIVKMGEFTRDELLDAEYYRTTTINWKLRFISFGMIILAISCVAKPLKAFGREVPTLDRILSGKFRDVGNLVLAGSYGSFIMSCIWAVYYPIISVGLLIVAVIPFL